MSLSFLFPFLTGMPAYRQLARELAQEGEHRAVIPDAARPYFTASLHQEINLPLLVLMAQPEGAKRFYDQLLIWCSDDSQPSLFPELNILPYEGLPPGPTLVRRRLEVLSRLSDVERSKGVPLVVASAPAIIWKLLPPVEFASACHTLEVGMRIDLSHLIARWRDIGYEMESIVELPGTMSRRGGILDVYSPNNDLPTRIEFSGNEIESIRFFDPSTQRSKELTSSVRIVPATEAGPNLQGSLISYLPQDSILLLDKLTEIQTAIEEVDKRANKLRLERNEASEYAPRPYFTWTELKGQLERVRGRLTLTKWRGDEIRGERCHYLDFSPAPNYNGRLVTFLKKVKGMLREGHRLVIVSHRARRLSELLEEEDVVAPPVQKIDQPPPPGSVTLLQGSLDRGWIIGPEESLILLTDTELFGFAKQRREPLKRPVLRQRLLADFSPGDYVVHTHHGIAKFAGLTRMSADGEEREYLMLDYAAGDRLYVPTDQADRVTRYSGGEPTLTKLGTQEWSRLKQRVKKATQEVAQGLLTLYAEREVIPGFPFSPDTEWQQELEASFPYVETQDQAEAALKVKEDMERDKPMDRLVCGDVGYGKTEVSLRAAFKAVMDGKQVAILVPTTVLAQQHSTTFNQRLATFPVKVEMLSRFRSQREQRDVLKELAHGMVDICIGTHRLLQKDVAFKDLGLVIIDEEQRFGVVHKERLKKMRKEVDVLTLTATPIPRTLHMSLIDVRDMSTMETPPEERLPIKIYVGQYDEKLVRGAILRELERNGQVFLVHNRVQTISRIANEVAKLVPEARRAIAHGQMPEEELERVMLDFSSGEIDVLVCTTIIESGLDIPNANTIVVNDSDMMGLAQLYQLRGRVGRGANRAYAYFLYAKEKYLTPAAQKRLETISRASELGAGFYIAMKDLEIRGAGSLLGTEQSGHIAAVGFDLYCQLLAEAVEELKAEKTPSIAPQLQMPTVDLLLRAHIPEDYIPQEQTRLSLYRRLAQLKSPEQVEEMEEEFRDRFGKLPAEVKNLLYTVKVKTLAAGAGISSISTQKRHILLKAADGIKLEPSQLANIHRPGIKIDSDQIKLDRSLLGNEWQAALEEILKKLPSACLPSPAAGV